MLSSPELIKLKLNEAQTIMMEQEKSMRVEIANLVRERDSLQKKAVKMEAEIHKLRRKKADADCDDANLRRRENRQRREKMKMKESGKSRLSKEDLPDFDEDAGIGSSKKGSNCWIAMVNNLVRGCKLERIVLIKDSLHKKNLERFEQSCFGHLLKISDGHLKFQRRLILDLLLHMDKDASRKRRMIFTIKNSKMEFSLGEFCHITGLTDLGTSAATATSSSIHKDVFQSRPNIFIKDIEEAFLKVSHDNGGRGELTLKLAFLYFLFGTLLGNQRKSVDLKYLHLIDDLHKFNVFPWGRIAYEFLLKSLSALRGRMDGAAATDRTHIGINVSGFTFALQIWAYEAVPSVAAYCASRAQNFDKGTPPILHWHTTKIIHIRDLEELFTPGDKAGRRLAHSVKTEDNQGKEPAEMRGCSRASATCSDDEVKMGSGDDDRVIVLSDSSVDEAPDADYCVGEDSNSILDDEEDSDNDTCSDSYINTLVAMLQSRKKRKKKDS